MSNLILLLLLNRLNIGFNTSYITNVQDLVGVPITAMVLNPIIEYDYKKIGLSIDNLYVSADCNVKKEDNPQEDSIDVHIGLNCAIATLYYRFDINKFQIAPCVGMIRIDAAGLAYGQLSSFSSSDQIDETRTGIYGGIKTTFIPTPKIGVKLLLSSASLKEGTFGEISASLMFKPFIKNTDENSAENRQGFLSSQLEHIYFTTNFSFARISVTIDEGSPPLPVNLVVYLIGVGYDW
ncbi:MAG: hypothetical protein PHX21_02220 [bacterium]|nr:hypothetical protein [bacterium]